MGNCCQRKKCSGTRHIKPLVACHESDNYENYNVGFADNKVKTTKYNIFTFIPLNLWQQLHRFANVYFIFIVCINFVPEIEAFGAAVAPIPVVGVLLVSMIKDGVEEIRRWLQDRKMNAKVCEVYSIEDDKFIDSHWKDIHCGDLVCIHANDLIPADVLLLHSSDSAGICYIETANLDGEISLKLREVVSGFVSESFNPQEFKYPIEIESPNKEIYKFSGTLFKDDEIVPLKKENLLFRGCYIRNTEYVIGMVVYAGNETKALMNIKGPRYKRSKLERQINKDVIWCVVMLVIFCLTGAIGGGIWLESFPSKEVIYITEINANDPVKSTTAYKSFINFWTYVIIFQAIIPLPLYVTFELIKGLQVLYLGYDVNLYDEESNKQIQINAYNVTEDLGQIQYIFADKTGTLTDNRMEFKRCCIVGRDYLDDLNTGFSETSASSTVPILKHDALTMGSDGYINPITSNGRAQSQKTAQDSLKSKSCADVDNNDCSNKMATDGKTDVESMSSLKGIIESTNLRCPPIYAGETEEIENEIENNTIREFAMLLAICNTAVVSKSKNEDKPERKLTLIDRLRKIVKNPIKRQHPAKRGKVKKTPRDGNNKKVARLSERRDGTSDHHGNGTTAAAATKTINKSTVPDIKFEPIKSPEHDNFLPPLDSKIDTPVDRLLLNKQIESILMNNGGDNSSITGSDVGSLIDFPTCPYKDEDLLSYYEVESPDELALVQTACRYGCKLIQRGPGFVTLFFPSDGIHVIEVLEILSFETVRKRMSVIVKHPYTRKLILYCKGADSAMFSVLRDPKDAKESEIMEKTAFQVTEYAKMGLRTLVMGMREISEKDYSAWAKKVSDFKRTHYAMTEEDEKGLSELMSEMECDLTLLGATGVEDCLQVGVPETIKSLREAGINIWVLTGDKQETAEQIGLSANIFQLNQTLFKLNSPSLLETEKSINEKLIEIQRMFPDEIEIRQRRQRPPVREELALIIDGHTLSFALDDSLKHSFLLLAEQCSSVICCRCTPYQKAEVVNLVKEELMMQTLAIGDGANDVTMIQAANVGVGVSGKEGMQAVMASDFAISKFRFLERLLLVHGNTNYDKLAMTALHMFYKDTLLVLVLFWYQLFNGFSASIPIDQIYAMIFNLTMTSLPPVLIGVWNRNLTPETLLKNPCLYKEGINCKSYLPQDFWINVIDALWQSLVVFFIPYLYYVDTDMGIWMFGDVLCTGMILAIFTNIGIDTFFWTGLHWLALVGSLIIAWFCFAMIYNVGEDFSLEIHPEASYWIIFKLMSMPSYWLISLTSVIFATFPRLVVTAIMNTVKPSLITRARQLERIYGVGKELPLKPKPSRFPVVDHSTKMNSRIRPSSAPASRHRRQASNNNPQNKSATGSMRNNIFHCGSQNNDSDDDVQYLSVVKPKPRQRRTLSEGMVLNLDLVRSRHSSDKKSTPEVSKKDSCEASDNETAEVFHQPPPSGEMIEDNSPPPRENFNDDKTESRIVIDDNTREAPPDFEDSEIEEDDKVFPLKPVRPPTRQAVEYDSTTLTDFDDETISSLNTTSTTFLPDTVESTEHRLFVDSEC